MRKIIAIKKMKKNYKVEFDSGEQITISENTLTEYLLTKDKLISEDLYNEIVAYQDLDYGKKTALTALNYRSYSVYEMKQKLISKEVEADKIPEIILFLKQNGLLNDFDYAQNIVESMIASKKKGRQAIAYKLKQKGIHPAVITEAISTFSTESEIDIATNYAEKLLLRFYRESTQAQKQKIIENLMRNGFNYDIAEQAVNQLEFTNSEDEEYENLVKKGRPVWRRVSRQYDGWDRKQRVFRNLATKGFDFDLINTFIDEMESEENE